MLWVLIRRPHWGSSNEYFNICFYRELRKYCLCSLNRSYDHMYPNVQTFFSSYHTYPKIWVSVLLPVNVSIMLDVWQTSIDPDQMLHSPTFVVSDLGLLYLLRPIPLLSIVTVCCYLISCLQDIFLLFFPLKQGLIFYINYLRELPSLTVGKNKMYLIKNDITWVEI